jgi:flagellar biosynthesis/type III secretory pathway protein FliH
MPGGIFKGSRATQGEAVQVEARLLELKRQLAPPGGEEGLDEEFQPGGIVDESVLEGESGADQADALRQEATRARTEQAEAHQKQHAQSEAERILEEAEQMATDIAGQAQQEASEIKERTVEEVEQLKRQAQEEIDARKARLEQEVRAELTAEYKQRFAAAVQSLEGLASTLQRQQADYLKSIEQPAFELVCELSRELLGAEISNAERVLPQLIARAFRLLRPERALTVYISPAVFQQLGESDLFASALSEQGLRLEKVELEIDESLSDGQFRAETAGSYVACDLPATVGEVIDELKLRAQTALREGLPEMPDDGSGAGDSGA